MEYTPHINYFAQTDFRGQKTTFGIKSEDRARHMYVIGKTGMGKSTLLENLAIQDIKNGEGLCFIDPHGGTAEKLLDFIPEERIKDVLYFAPFDLEYPVAFNVMEDIGVDKRHLVLSGLMSAFKKLFGEESFSDRMQYILQNTILALLEYPDATMLGINKMLSEKEYRNKVIANIQDPSVKSYWTKEYAGYTERFAAEAIPAIQNKIGQFTSNPLVRNIIGQTKSTFNFREVMDQKKILIINLSKGRLGESNANLLGSMIITKLYLSAMSRAEVEAGVLKDLPSFYLYVDEFQSFANESFADILSEARKYKLSLTIAHQYIEQMPEEVRAAVFGNVGTTISFRVGPFDAEVLEKIFFPPFTKEDIVNLGFAQIYLTLMIDGVGSPPFSAVTIPPIVPLGPSFREQIIDHSRRAYATPRAEVEETVKILHNFEASSQPAPKFESRPDSRPRPKQEPRPAPRGNFKPPARPEPPARAPRDESAKRISLSALSPKKAGNESNKMDLKAALEAVIKEVKSVPKPDPARPTPPEIFETKKEPPKNEVPEEVLKKILEV